jgi:hypothetical protein
MVFLSLYMLCSDNKCTDEAIEVIQNLPQMMDSLTAKQDNVILTPTPSRVQAMDQTIPVFLPRNLPSTIPSLVRDDSSPPLTIDVNKGVECLLDDDATSVVDSVSSKRSLRKWGRWFRTPSSVSRPPDQLSIRVLTACE